MVDGHTLEARALAPAKPMQPHPAQPDQSAVTLRVGQLGAPKRRLDR